MSEQLERVSRQLLLPGWTLVKQQQLGALTATTDASWGLAALYLAGAGVRSHIICGPDAVGWQRRVTNLLPEARTSQSPTAECSLMLSAADSTPLLRLQVSPCTNGHTIERQGAARAGSYWKFDNQGLGQGEIIHELFVASALATIALRWFSLEG